MKEKKQWNTASKWRWYCHNAGQPIQNTLNFGEVSVMNIKCSNAVSRLIKKFLMLKKELLPFAVGTLNQNTPLQHPLWGGVASHPPHDAV